MFDSVVEDEVVYQSTLHGGKNKNTQRRRKLYKKSKYRGGMSSGCLVLIFLEMMTIYTLETLMPSQ